MAASKRSTARTPRDAGAVHVEPSARTQSTIDPSYITSAEVMADSGHLWLAADIVEQMLSDDRITRCTEALSSITALPLRFSPPDGETEPEDYEPSVALDRDWWRFNTEAELGRIIAWGRILGVAIGHIDEWRVDEQSGRWLPILRAWSPRHLRLDAVDRHWWIKLADYSEVRADDTESDRWVLHMPNGKSRPWSVAPWRWLARLWLLKRYAAADWARYSERQGMGIGTVTEAHPSGGAGDMVEELTAAERRKLADDIRQLGRGGVVVLPRGFDLRLVESQARSWETFRAQTDMADAAIAIALCGNNLTTEIRGGSYAAATVHADVEARVIRRVAESLSTDLREQQLRWYCTYNFGSASMAPWPQWETRPPADRSARAETLVKVSTALTQFRSAGYVLPIEQVNEEFGLQLEEAPVPQPPVAPPLDDDGEDAETDEDEDVDGGAQEPEEDAEARAMAAGPSAGPRAQDGAVPPARAAVSTDHPGQRFVDEVVARVVPAAAEGLEPTVRAVIAAVRDAESYSAAYAEILRRYEGMRTPAELAEITEAALLLCDLAGHLEAWDEVLPGDPGPADDETQEADGGEPQAPAAQ